MEIIAKKKSFSCQYGNSCGRADNNIDSSSFLFTALFNSNRLTSFVLHTQHPLPAYQLVHYDTDQYG